MNAMLDRAAAWWALVPLTTQELWAIGLTLVLALRALLVLTRGPAGAAWRTVTALLAGALVVVWAATAGLDVSALPLHLLAVVVVALTPWERPHAEAPQLRLGRARRRSRLPWARALLLLVVTGLALAWVFMA